VLPFFDQDASEILTYKFLDGYDALIEPYASMDLSLLDEEDEEESSSYRYSVCAVDDETKCYKGEYSATSGGKTTPITVKCDPFDVYTMTVSQFDKDGNTVRTGSGDAICMYVRREIQSLSGDDLDATMDAMYTLWSVEEDEGQKLYGSNYHPASYFSAAHDFNAAQQDADHIHEGLGFLPQHIKLTNIFELAMQAVDPSVSLPYWDFTIDVAENKTIFESAMFTERTFGSLTKPKSHFWGFRYKDDSIDATTIQDGRWANIKAENNNCTVTSTPSRVYGH
jgi:hypothetical protein